MAWGQIASLMGPQGPQGPEGPPGPQGPPGEDGAGIAIAGSVEDYSGLPDDLGEEDAGAAYLNQDDGKLYIWDGESWPAEGSGVEFRGPQGPQGEIGPQGPAGPQGPRGATWFTGTGAPGSIPGAEIGDLYLDTETGVVYLLT